MDNESTTSMRIVVTGSVATHAEKKPAKLFGKDYSVFPSTMMVAGSHYPHVERAKTNADQAKKPTSINFSEHELQRSVNTWNGRPVSINHPDNQITCNSPDTYNRQWVGYVFNTRYDKPAQSLKSELWIENERGKVVNDLVSSGKQLEVSIGVFGQLKQSKGNDPFDFDMANIVGDHLAILPNSKGACSWEDGCGIRAEQYRPASETPTEITNIEMRGEEMEQCQELRGKEKEQCLEEKNAPTNQSVKAARLTQPEKVRQMSGKGSPEANFDYSQWWSEAPAEFRSYLTNSMKNYDRQKEGYVNKILSCKAAVFCEKALNGLEDMSILEGISDLVDAVSESSKAVAATSTGNYQFKAGSSGKTEPESAYATFKDINFKEMEKERQEKERVRRVRNV